MLPGVDLLRWCDDGAPAAVEGEEGGTGGGGGGGGAGGGGGEGGRGGPTNKWEEGEGDTSSITITLGRSFPSSLASPLLIFFFKTFERRCCHLLLRLPESLAAALRPLIDRESPQDDEDEDDDDGAPSSSSSTRKCHFSDRCLRLPFEGMGTARQGADALPRSSQLHRVLCSSQNACVSCSSFFSLQIFLIFRKLSKQEVVYSI